VEVLSADHQNKPDVAVSLAREWFDQRGVDIIIDVAATSCALALAGVCKEMNKVLIPTSTASSDITGSACTPNSIHPRLASPRRQSVRPHPHDRALRPRCQSPAAGATTGRRSCLRITSSNSNGGTTTNVIKRKSLLKAMICAW
jgi:hypothetical protein